MIDLCIFPITRKSPPRHPERLQLYSLPTPNGLKVSIARALDAFVARPAVARGLDIPPRL